MSRLPRPRTLASVIILVTALAFTAGWLRNELALILLGTVFLIILAYSFLGVFIVGLLNRRKARLLSMVIAPEALPVGKEAELCIRLDGVSSIKRLRFFKLPAILVRAELRLETVDGRVIHRYIEPGVEACSRFPVKERGAYYGENGRLVIFDAPGFFSLSLPVRQSCDAPAMTKAIAGERARLLAVPRPTEEPARLSLKSGAATQQNIDRRGGPYRKSGEFTDHRPYIPGDDPRRINWKLYGHAPLGELFVREGEPEPPPHSRLLILIDTEVDLSLYTVDEGRLAVDLLCENALAAALELSGQGMDILIGYSGKIPGDNSTGRIIGGGGQDLSSTLNTAVFAAALALPAASFRGESGAFLSESADFPPVPQDVGILTFALPRTNRDLSALDRFLKNREAKQETDIVFLYDALDKQAAELEEAARICANLYNNRPGVHAERIAVRGKQGGGSA